MAFIKGWKQLFGAHTHFQNIFIDPIVSARKKAEKRDRHEEREKERKRRFGVNAIISAPSSVTDDGVDAETSLSFFLSLFISISLLRLFSRAHYWVNKYILAFIKANSWQQWGSGHTYSIKLYNSTSKAFVAYFHHSHTCTVFGHTRCDSAYGVAGSVTMSTDLFLKPWCWCLLFEFVLLPASVCFLNSLRSWLPKHVGRRPCCSCRSWDWGVLESWKLARLRCLSENTLDTFLVFSFIAKPKY